MIAMVVSGILVLMIMYFLYDSGSSQRMNPEYRKLSNILYEAQQTNSTVLMLHLQKKARFTTLNSRTAKKYANKEEYYAQLVHSLLDWQTLSKNGALFDPTVLEDQLKSPKPILLKQRDMILVKLDAKIADSDPADVKLTNDTAIESLVMHLHMM